MSKHTEYLIKLKDEDYADFSAKLIPNIEKERIIGVRVPLIRKYAKELVHSDEYADFLTDLPHRCHEEDQLHTFIVSLLSDYDDVIKLTEEFLPYVDNWAVCDGFCPKIFSENKADLYERIKAWLSSEHTYTKRFAILMLINFYLGSDFVPEHLNIVAETEGDDYYLKMAKAWYFATALAKQYEATIKILEASTLDKWTHNKTIQKAVESYRISDEIKKYLKTLRIK